MGGMTQGSVEPDHLLIGSSSTITCLFADSEGSLFSGNEFGQIIWWSLDTHRPFVEWRAHSKSVLSIDFIRCVSAYVSQGRDGLIKFWHLDALTHSHSQILSSITTSELTFCRLSLWNLTNSSAYLCHLVQDKSANEKLEIVHFPSHTIGYQLEPIVHQKLGMCTALQGWEHHILACYESGHVILFDLHESTATQNHQILAKQVTDTTIMAMSFHPSTGRGVIGTADLDHIAVFSLDVSAKELSIVKNVTLTNPGVGCAAWRDDGRLFATGGGMAGFGYFPAEAAKALAVLDWSNVVCMDGGEFGGKSDAVKSVQCVLFTRDRYLVSAGGDRSVCVWSVYKDS